MSRSPATRSSTVVDLEQQIVVVRSLVDSAQQLLLEVKSTFESLRQQQPSDKVFTLVQQTVVELDRIVRSGNGDSLVTQIRLLQEQHDRTLQAQRDLLDQLEQHEQRLDELWHRQHQASGVHRALQHLMMVGGWLVATVISVIGLLLRAN